MDRYRAEDQRFSDVGAGTDASIRERRPSFASGEGLRTLLVRLHQAGSGAWRTDPEAEMLMRYATDKYAHLARAHRLPPEDAAYAAYEAMQAASTRRAQDPWAVVTTAVRVSLNAEERAHGLLTSPERARRKATRAWHDPQRFSDRDDEDHDLTRYHPSLATTAGPETVLASDEDEAAREAREAISGAITVLVVCGWPPRSAHVAIDYVCDQLIRSGGRARAYRTLRRDQVARVLLDLTRVEWMQLLRLMLGDPSSPRIRARHGLLARLILGDDLVDLRDLIVAVDLAHTLADDPERDQ